MVSIPGITPLRANIRQRLTGKRGFGDSVPILAANEQGAERGARPVADGTSLVSVYQEKAHKRRRKSRQCWLVAFAGWHPLSALNAGGRHKLGGHAAQVWIYNIVKYSVELTALSVAADDV